MEQISIVLAITIPLLAVIVGLVWFLSYFLNRKYVIHIDSNDNSVRSLIVDRVNKVVHYFNRNDIRNMRTMKFDQFYLQYSKEDAMNLELWLNELTKKYSKAREIFEIMVYTKKNKRRFYSVLKATHVDKDRKVINLDSYIFPNLSNKSRLTYYLRDKTIDQQIAMLKVHLNLRGFTANFRFSFMSDSGANDEINRLLFIQLKEIAAGFVNTPYKQMLQTADNQFVLFDYRTNNHDDSVAFINKIIASMHKYLEINGKIDNVNISVGLVYNSYFPGETKKIIAKAQEMSNVAYEKNVLIITYSNKAVNNPEEAKYRSEIEEIVKEKKLRYLFVPTYDVKKGKVIGYYTSTIPRGSNEEGMEELYRRAVKTNETRDLLQSIVKETFEIFAANKTDDNLILFRLLKFADVPVFLSFTRSNAAKGTRIAVVFDEFDISFHSSKNRSKDFFDKIDKLKAKNIMVCLSLSNKSLILESKIYACFDYFIVYRDPAITKFMKTDAINFDLRTIMERMIKYNKPIILANVDGWDTIELFVRSGIEYIVSGTIAPMSEKLSVPNAKTKAKIKRMLN